MMKKYLLFLSAMALAATLIGQKSIPAKLDELMTAYTRVNKFNGSVLVARKGQVLLAKGYGIKNAKLATKLDASSIFQIYSVTKTFTSTVILQLVEQGKLSLTDKLNKFYRGYPMGDSITIEHLLTHTSGIYDYTQGNNMPDQTENSFLTFLQNKPLDFAPGSNWRYSNSGYYLLGFIIGKITGMTYEEAVAKFIFKPLNMTSSGFFFKQLSNSNKATGYEIFTQQVKKESIIYDPPGPFSAGGIYSTVGDLFKFHQGLESFKLLSSETQAKAYTAYKNGYGYGWMIRSLNGMSVISHSGGAAGFRSNFIRVPAEDICIVFLDNTENANLEALARQVLNLLDAKPYHIPIAVNVDPAVLQKYTGTYQVSPGFTLYVTLEQGRIVVQATNQQKTWPMAEKENLFFVEEANGYLSFTSDGKGLYEELVIDQGGQKITAKRIQAAWGLIWSGSNDNWQGTNDIQFTADTIHPGHWYISDLTLNTGEIKFRYNNDWTINYGDNGNDKMLDEYGANISVQAGKYDIQLDLTDLAKPRYSITFK